MTKEKYFESLKYFIDLSYNSVITDFGYFLKGSQLNIYMASNKDLKYLGLSTTNPDGSPRYVTFVCY